LEDAILSADPPRPSTVATAAAAAARGTTQKGLSRALSGDLDTITLKALKKVPAERYLTVDALSRDIEHYLRGEAVTARADATWYRFSKFVGRHKLPVAAGTAAALILVATATIALVEARSAEAERDRALALSARSAAVSEFVKMLVTESGGSDAPVTVSDMMARSGSLLASEYSQNPEHRAAILAVLGDYYHTVGKDKLAEPMYSSALQSLQRSADPGLRLELTCGHAMTLAGEGNIKAVLNDAIKAGGSSLRDHRRTDGDLGDFQHSFRVYDRAGEKCPTPKCKGKIRRIVQGTRSTFFCPVCQK